MTVRVQRLCSQTHGLVRDFVIRAIDWPGESFNDRITRRPEPGTAIRHERCCSSAFLLHVRRSIRSETEREAFHLAAAAAACGGSGVLPAGRGAVALQPGNWSPYWAAASQ